MVCVGASADVHACSLCKCYAGRPKRQAAPTAFQNEDQQGADHIDIESPVDVDHAVRPAPRTVNEAATARGSQLQQPSQLTIPAAAQQVGCPQVSPVQSPYGDIDFQSDDEAADMARGGLSKPAGKTPQLGGQQGGRKKAPSSAQARTKAMTTGRAGAKAASAKPTGGGKELKGTQSTHEVSCSDSAALVAKIANAAKPPLPLQSSLGGTKHAQNKQLNPAMRSAGVMPAAAAAQHALLPAEATPEMAPAASKASAMPADVPTPAPAAGGAVDVPGIQNQFMAFLANVMQGAQGNGAAMQQAEQMFQQMFASFAAGNAGAMQAPLALPAPAGRCAASVLASL